MRLVAIRPLVVTVAPFTGAWIEIKSGGDAFKQAAESLPSRERGLKFELYFQRWAKLDVAPFTGAWIEMNWPINVTASPNCRSLHGSVD